MWTRSTRQFRLAQRSQRLAQAGDNRVGEAIQLLGLQFLSGYGLSLHGTFSLAGAINPAPPRYQRATPGCAVVHGRPPPVAGEKGSNSSGQRCREALFQSLAYEEIAEGFRF